ncbi:MULTISPECIES: hypothetical protein [unclassified Burkholderia]|nr:MULTISPECIES: hypothetical protein [unclassified Burkholderia]
MSPIQAGRAFTAVPGLLRESTGFASGAHDIPRVLAGAIAHCEAAAA